MFATSREERALLVGALSLLLVVSCAGLASRLGWFQSPLTLAADTAAVAPAGASAGEPAPAAVPEAPTKEEAVSGAADLEVRRPASGRPLGAGEAEAGPLVDLNTATFEELLGLPGIGPALAARILEYRRERGGFHSAEELLNIKGIGRARFEKLLPLVTVSPPGGAS